jgi:hypothetical protein
VIAVEARRRLAKAIPLLGSPVDAEALGAARALARILEAAGHDLHDLAVLIEPSEWEARIESRRDHPASPSPTSATGPGAERQPPKPRKERRASFGDFTPRQRRSTIAEILKRSKLTREEREFLRTMSERAYTDPHVLPFTEEIRKLNRIWRRGDAAAEKVAA